MIHDLEVEKRGGVFGVRDFGLLHSITFRPQMAMMGKEFYPTLFEKAAALLEAVATYHVFADGNKRTAFLTSVAFLNMNEYDFHATNIESYRFVLAVAVKKKSIQEIAAWLKKHSKRTKLCS